MPAEMYNIPDGNSSTKGNELGIFEGINDVYAQEDLDLFFKTVAKDSYVVPPSPLDSMNVA